MDIKKSFTIILTSFLGLLPFALANQLIPVVFLSASVYCVLSFSAIYQLVKHKRNPAENLIVIFVFVFFFLHFLSPVSYSLRVDALKSYDSRAVALGWIAAFLTPIFLKIGMHFWNLVFGRQLNRILAPLTGNDLRRLEGFIFWAFVFWFSLTFITYLTGGKLVLYSISNIVNLRGGSDSGFGFRGSFGALRGLSYAPLSLVLFLSFLWKTKYRRICSFIAPLVILWAAGDLFGGTRTTLLMGAVCLFIYYSIILKFSGRLIALVCVVFVGIFFVAQTLIQVRHTGWNQFSLDKQYFEELVDVRGLQTLQDQSRAFQYVLEGYYRPWVDFGPVGNLLIATPLRGAEFVYFWLPRTLFPMKPLDPTFQLFTEYSILADTGQVEKKMFTGSGTSTGYGSNKTAGLFGRDIVRYGLVGIFICSFWLSLLFYTGAKFLVVGSHRLHLLAGAAILATAIAMFRGLEIHWTVRLMPFFYSVLSGLIFVRLGQKKFDPKTRFKSGRLAPKGHLDQTRFCGAASNRTLLSPNEAGSSLRSALRSAK